MVSLYSKATPHPPKAAPNVCTHTESRLNNNRFLVFSKSTPHPPFVKPHHSESVESFSAYSRLGTRWERVLGTKKIRLK